MYFEKFDNIEDFSFTFRNIAVLLDSDVAAIYGVDINEITRALKRNPEKFLPGYVFKLGAKEKKEVIKDYPKLQFYSARPKVFSLKGFYMLSTVLISERSVGTAIEIVDTFVQLREFMRNAKRMTEPQPIKEKFTLFPIKETIPDITVGDIVRSKSGGKNMTVKEINGNMVVSSFITDDNKKVDCICKINQLVKVTVDE